MLLNSQEQEKSVKLENYNFLVTGGSRGVGLAIVEKLLGDGHTVYSLSRKKTTEIDQLMVDYPGKLHFKEFDLINPDSIRKAIFKEWIPLSVPLHGFVNNAAMAYDDIVTNMRLEPLEKMYAVNVFSPFLMVKYAIRNMLFNRIAGSIIHISSISVHTGYKGLSMYASSKGALEGFSKNTAREWGSKGVRSNCIVAGFMDTEMSASLDADQKNRIYKRTSMKKPVDPAVVANTTAFLLYPNSASITGQNIFVDSGTI